MSIDAIEPADFDYVSTKLREFFKTKGLIEVPVQHRLSILAACEDPTTISTFPYQGQIWPLPQTGQMHLEMTILNEKEPSRGYFCYSTSYRAEANPIIGRHNLIFPMFEFEIPGNMDDLLQFHKELLIFLGYDETQFYEADYSDLCKKYQVSELTHAEETKLAEDYGPVCFIKNFPFSTSPFWNMKANMEKKTANKIDVILSGIETIGSAERSCNPEEMRYMFHNISDSMYADLLYSKFTKERVEKELENFLANNFVSRAGAGIGITRLIRSLKKEGLMK